MTVTDLILNFRDALVGLLPAVDRVNMPWRPPDAYDEWDELAQAVYEALVIWPLRWTLPVSEHARFHVPSYDLLLPSYAGKSLIEVLPARGDGVMKSFHALGTSEAPFDTVEWRAVTPTGSPQSDLLESMPLESARFALRLCTNGYSETCIEDVAITS